MALRVRGQNKVSFPDEAFWMIEVSKICYLIASGNRILDSREIPTLLVNKITNKKRVIILG